MINSSKLVVAVVAMGCITGIYGYALHLDVKVPLEFTGFITGIAGSFGLFKTVQNVVFNGNGGSK